MTNPHLKAAFLDIFESVGYTKERLKERLNKRNHPLTGYKDNDITLIQNYIIFEWEKLSRQFGNVANLNLLIGFWIAYGTILIFHNWFL